MLVFTFNLAFAVTIFIYWCIEFYQSIPCNHNQTILQREMKIEGLSQMLYKNDSMFKDDPIIVSFVACRKRFDESLNLMKSIIIFTKSPIYFIIFTDDILWSRYQKTLNHWQSLAPHHGFKFELKKICFPAYQNQKWLHLFAECSAQRLFLPDLLLNINKILYVDIDTLFLGPVEELWDKFNEFNETHISALVAENENPRISWYQTFAHHPFYGKYGLNAGMILMDLQKMRDFGWLNYVMLIYKKWKTFINFGDQDIINILFHDHPNTVHVLSCKYNYRLDHCMKDGDTCEDANKNGLYLIHGNKKMFHKKKQVFNALYQAMDEYQLGVNTVKDLIEKIYEYVTNEPEDDCSILKKILLNIQIPYLMKLADRQDKSL